MIVVEKYLTIEKTISKTSNGNRSSHEAQSQKINIVAKEPGSIFVHEVDYVFTFISRMTI